MDPCFGYKLVYYKLRSPRLYEGIAKIELLENSKLVDQRQHEIYDTLKTNLARVVDIKPLSDNCTEITEAYLEKSSVDPFVRQAIKVGSILRVKHADFTNNEKCITFYSTREGVRNLSSEITPGFTGTKIWYYSNGLVREKHYLVMGIKYCVLGFYNNAFNTLHYTWNYEAYPNEAFPIIREYLYNEQENPMAQYIIREGQVVSKLVYDRTFLCDSVFLKSANI